MIARHVAIGVLACIASLGIQAQQSLADLVSDARADWMFTKWEAQDDQGRTVGIEVSWDLDKKVAVLHVKMGAYEIKGYTYRDPDVLEPKYFGFDSQGTVYRGNWGLDGDDLVLRLESKKLDGSTEKVAAAFTGSPADGLTVRIHGIESWGGLVQPARSTTKFKKK